MDSWIALSAREARWALLWYRFKIHIFSPRILGSCPEAQEGYSWYYEAGKGYSVAEPE